MTRFARQVSPLDLTARRGAAAPELAPIVGRWVRVGGLRMHLRASAAPTQPGALPVVLVHGLTVSSRYMVPVAQRIGLRRPAIAPDLPGFGLSERRRHVLDIGELAEALAGCLDACGVERAALVGHSMGCQTVAEFVRRYPERAAAVTLVGPSVDRHARSAVTQTWRLAIDGTRTPPSSVLILMRDFSECGFRRTLVTLGHALRDRPEDKLPGFSMPTLIVRGDRDPLAPQRWVEELAAAAPHGRLVNVPGASHAVHYEQPELTARLVEEVIAEAAAGVAEDGAHAA